MSCDAAGCATMVGPWYLDQHDVSSIWFAALVQVAPLWGVGARLANRRCDGGLRYSSCSVTAQVSQARSADAQVHDQAEWVGGERSQHIPALLFGGREQRPDDPEISRSVLGAKAAGDLLLQLHHPTIAFGLVVGERHGGIGQEAEHILFAGAQTKQEVMTHAARRRSAAFPFAGRADQRGLRRMEREALREDRIITSFDQCDETRGQRHASFAGEVRPMAGTAQQTLNLARPVFALDLDQRLEFTQVMRVA